jgi:hypothetical protein
VEGKYIARNESETPLSIKDICAYMKNRAGFTGSYKDAIDHVEQFLNEAMYQLCNGKAVNMGYYSIHSNVGGSFNSALETHDHTKNPVTFRFRCRKAMRDLARNTQVVITAVADTKSYINDFMDISSEAVNDTVMSGAQFILTGHKIKVEGNSPLCGIYFEHIADKVRGRVLDEQRIKVQGRLAENSPKKIIGTVPRLEASSKYRVIIISQFTGSGTLLKTPRETTSSFTLEAA